MINYSERCKEILNRFITKRPEYKNDDKLIITYHSEGALGIIYEIWHNNKKLAYGPYKLMKKYEFKNTENKQKRFSAQTKIEEELNKKNLKFIGPLIPYTVKHPGLTGHDKFLFEDTEGYVYTTTYFSQKNSDFSFHNCYMHIPSNMDKINDVAERKSLSIITIDESKHTIEFVCKKCGRNIKEHINKKFFKKANICDCLYNQEYNEIIGRNSYDNWTEEQVRTFCSEKFKGQYKDMIIEHPERCSRMIIIFLLDDESLTKPRTLHDLQRKTFKKLSFDNRRFPNMTYEEYVMNRLKENDAVFGGIIDESDKLYSHTKFWYIDRNGVPRQTSYLPGIKTLEKSQFYIPEIIKILKEKWEGHFEYVSHTDDSITRRCLFCNLETTQRISNALKQVGECVCRTPTLSEFKKKIEEKTIFVFPNIDNEYTSKNSLLNGICNASEKEGYFLIEANEILNVKKVCSNCSLSKVCKLRKFSAHKTENYIALTLTLNNIPFKMHDRKTLNGKEIDFIFEINGVKYPLEHQGLQHFENVPHFRPYKQQHSDDFTKNIEIKEKFNGRIIYTKGNDCSKYTELFDEPLYTPYNFLDVLIDNPIYPEDDELNLIKLEEIRKDHLNDSKYSSKKKTRKNINNIIKKTVQFNQKLEKFNIAAEESFYISGILKAKYPEMYNFWRNVVRKHKEIEDRIISSGNSSFYLISDLNNNPVFTIIGESEIEKYLGMTYASLYYSLNNETPVMLSREILEPVFYIKKIDSKNITVFLRDEEKLNEIIMKAKNATKICKYNREGICVQIYNNKNDFLIAEKLENDKGSRILRLHNSEHNEHRFKYYKDTNGNPIESYYPFKHIIESRKIIKAYDYETKELKYIFEYAKQSDEFLNLKRGTSAAACSRKYNYTDTEYGRLILRYEEKCS